MFNSNSSDSASVSAVFSNLCSFNCMLVFANRKKLQGSCCTFDIVLQVLAHRNSAMYLVVFQQTEHEFCSIRPASYLNPRLRCVRKYRMKEFYKNRKSYVVCHNGCYEAPFPGYMSHLTTGDVNIQNLWKKSGHFCKVNNIQRSMFCSWFYHQKFLF
jgi:hypothetical protein